MPFYSPVRIVRQVRLDPIPRDGPVRQQKRCFGFYQTAEEQLIIQTWSISVVAEREDVPTTEFGGGQGCPRVSGGEAAPPGTPGFAPVGIIRRGDHLTGWQAGELGTVRQVVTVFRLPSAGHHFGREGSSVRVVLVGVFSPHRWLYAFDGVKGRVAVGGLFPVRVDGLFESFEAVGQLCGGLIEFIVGGRGEVRVTVVVPQVISRTNDSTSRVADFDRTVQRRWLVNDLLISVARHVEAAADATEGVIAFPVLLYVVHHGFHVPAEPVENLRLHFPFESGFRERSHRFNGVLLSAEYVCIFRFHLTISGRGR